MNRDLVLRGEDRHVSPVPVLGAIFGLLAVVIMPLGLFRQRAWFVPIPLAMEFVVWLAYRRVWDRSGLRQREEAVRQRARGAGAGAPRDD
jgi:hypothetical protein